MRLTLATILLGLAIPAIADKHSADADGWYKDRYAALWAESSWDKLDEIAGHYAETVTYHPGDGDATMYDSASWLAEAVEEWRAEDWVGSDLVGYRSVALNPGTVSIYTQWLDRYDGGYEESSCGWYLGAMRNGAWRITDYAEIDCTAHGF